MRSRRPLHTRTGYGVRYGFAAVLADLRSASVGWREPRPVVVVGIPLAGEVGNPARHRARADVMAGPRSRARQSRLGSWQFKCTPPRARLTDAPEAKALRTPNRSPYRIRVHTNDFGSMIWSRWGLRRSHGRDTPCPRSAATRSPGNRCPGSRARCARTGATTLRPVVGVGTRGHPTTCTGSGLWRDTGPGRH